MIVENLIRTFLDQTEKQVRIRRLLFQGHCTYGMVEPFQSNFTRPIPQQPIQRQPRFRRKNGITGQRVEDSLKGTHLRIDFSTFNSCKVRLRQACAPGQFGLGHAKVGTKKANPFRVGWRIGRIRSLFGKTGEMEIVYEGQSFSCHTGIIVAKADKIKLFYLL